MKQLILVYVNLKYKLKVLFQTKISLGNVYVAVKTLPCDSMSVPLIPGVIAWKVTGQECRIWPGKGVGHWTSGRSTMTPMGVE